MAFLSVPWMILIDQRKNYSVAIMNAMASPITGVSIDGSTVGSGADWRKHQTSASLAFVKGIHRWPVNSPHKRPVMRKRFPFDDVIMSIPQNLGHSVIPDLPLTEHQIPFADQCVEHGIERVYMYAVQLPIHPCISTQFYFSASFVTSLSLLSCMQPRVHLNKPYSPSAVCDHSTQWLVQIALIIC